MALTIRRLEPADDRSDFASGNVDLDRFFKQYAGQNQFRHHVGVTYVAIEDRYIAGYVTVTASELVPSTMPTRTRRGLPRHGLPALRLARLAVDARARGRGVGEALLRTAFAIARRLADEVGCVGVAVDAKPDAVAFYARFGFERIELVGGPLGDRPAPPPMFLALAQIPIERDA